MLDAKCVYCRQREGEHQYKTGQCPVPDKYRNLKFIGSKTKFESAEHLMSKSDAGLKFVEKHLEDLCAELLEWHVSALLQKENSKFQVLVRILGSATPHTAEDMIKRAAMQRVVGKQYNFVFGSPVSEG